MEYLDNLRIRARLNFGFATILVLAAAMAAWGVVNLSRQNDATQTIVTQNWVKAEHANRIAALAKENGIRSLNLLMLVNSSEITETKAAMEEAKGEVNRLFDELKAMDASSEERLLFDDADATHFDPPGDPRWRRRLDAAGLGREHDLVIGDQACAAVDQPERQIRLAAARRSAQQHAETEQLDTGAVDEHRAPPQSAGRRTVNCAPVTAPLES